jgi:hypothetical protein
MTPELQKALAELLAKMMTYADDAVGFAKDQIPPLIQEKIAYGRAWETSVFVVGFISCFILWRFAMRTWRWEKGGGTNDENRGLPTVLVSIVSVVASMATLSQLNSMLLVWFAPRLYIVEWLKSMVVKQ